MNRADDGVNTIKLVEDISPMSFNGNTGYSFLVSNIDKNSKLSKSIGNVTVIPHNGKIYESIFNAPPSTYDISSNMLNDMLLSIEWLN